MNSKTAESLISSIDQTIIDIDSVSGKDRLTDSFLAKFLVVYISGIYEEAIETIILDYLTRKKIPKEIQSYMQHQIKLGFQNPKFDRICELIGKFDNTWRMKIEIFKGTGTAFSLDSIVENKNSLAHGSPTTITLLDVKYYYVTSKDIISVVDSIFI